MAESRHGYGYAKFIESKQPSDYESNIDALAAEGYNVTSLMFAEEQIGFLAGGMSGSGFVCSVSTQGKETALHLIGIGGTP